MLNTSYRYAITIQTTISLKYHLGDFIGIDITYNSVKISFLQIHKDNQLF